MDQNNTRPNVHNSVPDRWLAYKPHGTVIQGTNIVAFKVPLKEAISKNLPPKERFTPATLMAAFPKLRFIIDLTYTNRYYHPEEFTVAGVKHIKILIPGKLLPSLDRVKKFFKAMDTFTSCANDDEIIGVHCTHGINRTGYLICRYLVQQLGWEPQKSVKAFEKARGYAIERDAYVTAVMSAPRTKLDLTSVTLEDTQSFQEEASRYQPRRPPMQSKFDMRRRGFPNERPYPPPPRQPFGFRGPPHAFGPRPPIPPPSPASPGRLYGPRPHAYGMAPMRPPMPPPGPGPFPGVRFPPRMSGPPRMPGPPRLPPPPVGPQQRLPGPGMPPPRLPPPGMIPPRLGLPPRMAPPRHPLPGIPSPRLSNVRRSLEHLRGDVQGRGPIPQGARITTAPSSQGASPKILKDVDFTLDTFEENLTASVRP